MGHTASSAISRIVLKAWTSTARGLSDSQLLELLNDSLRSYVVPFTKTLRDEWWVSEDIELTTDSDGKVAIPNSVASTLRTVAWNNSGILCPLPRIEPESSFGYQPSSSSGNPAGFMLRGYSLEILPRCASVPLVLTVMKRPHDMVLDGDAGEIASHASLALTLEDVPLAWQSSAPTAVDLISNESPFSPIAEDVTVSSLAGSVLTLSGISASLVEDGFWVADVGETPFPNIPIELHPLLEQHVIVTMFAGLGDKRLDAAGDLLKKYEADLRRTMSPRTQGSSRPLLNPTAPGMRSGFWRYGG